jgi:hypothetical protein
MRAIVAVSALSLVMAGSAAAQVLEGSAQTYTMQSHVQLGTAVLEQTGQWIGGDVALTWRGVRIALGSAFGSLTGVADSLHPDSKGRTTGLSAYVKPMRWLSLGVLAEAKVFETDLGTTAWRLIGVNVRATPRLDESFEALVDATYWPMAEIMNGTKMSLALRTVVGATYYPAGGRVGIRAAYRLERFDFADGSDRLQQFRGATLGAVLRVGR